MNETRKRSNLDCLVGTAKASLGRLPLAGAGASISVLWLPQDPNRALNESCLASRWLPCTGANVADRGEDTAGLP